MGKRAITFFICVLLILPITVYAKGFSTTPEDVETAAKSVLMLEVMDSNDEVIASGSGFVVFNNRTIVTNYHVIEDAEWVLGTSDEGYQYMITKVLIADKEKDIAICEFLSPTDLVPLELNVTEELKRIEVCVAIGSPRGLKNTVSVGNISALYKEDGLNWIQFTAPISHGSSGGALFDDDGKVIGVTSAISVNTDDQNINFAIHASEIQKLFEDCNRQAVSFTDYFIGTAVTPTPSPAPVFYSNNRRTYRNLYRGSMGDDVSNLQQALQDLGYLGDDSTFTLGKYDEVTATAVYNFRICNGIIFSTIQMNRIANPSLQKLLFEGAPIAYDETLLPSSTPSPSPTPKPTPIPYKTLKKGDKGDDVKRLQEKLIILGYLDGKADGVFGTQTAEAVRLFAKSVIYYETDVATPSIQSELFDGNPKAYTDPVEVLTIKDGAYAEWIDMNNDMLKIHFQVTNIGRKTTVDAFELYVYATDVWGNRLYGEDIYTITTNRKISPGETIYSDYITIPDRSSIKTVYARINKLAYTSGVIRTCANCEYVSWIIK